MKGREKDEGGAGMAYWMAGICFAVMVIFYLLYEGSKFSDKFSKRVSTVFKCTTTSCAVLLAVYGAALHGGANWLLAAGLLICAVADGVLVYYFIPGMGIFGLGHIAYCAAYILKSPPGTLNFLLMAFLMAGVTFGALKFKKRMGKRVVPFTMYALILCVMLALGATQTPLLALGALFFIISDATLARNILLGATRRQDYFSLGCYYLGQFLIAASILF